MTIRVGINGFGRIGRNFWRAVHAAAGGRDIEIVAANDLGDMATFAHLLKYDTVLGTLDLDIHAADGAIMAGDQRLLWLAERDPAALPWRDLGVDVVIESTGRFTKADDARKHLDGRREEGDHLRPRQGRGHHHRDGRQRRRLRPRPARHHLQRLLHHQLCRADGQGAAGQLRHRQGPDDHHPRLHQRPGASWTSRTRTCAAPAPPRRTSSPPPPAPPGPPRWCCPSSRASSTGWRCGCRSWTAR